MVQAKFHLVMKEQTLDNTNTLFRMWALLNSSVLVLEAAVL